MVVPKDDHVVLEQRWQCPDGGKLIYRVTLFHEIDPASRHMVSVDGERKFIGLLSVQAPEMALTESVPTTWQTAWKYVVSGIEHIAIGYDHIAFLLAVIVLGRRFWPLVKVVTAFTIAHSITLTIAVLGIATRNPICHITIATMTISSCPISTPMLNDARASPSASSGKP